MMNGMTKLKHHKQIPNTADYCEDYVTLQAVAIVVLTTSGHFLKSGQVLLIKNESRSWEVLTTAEYLKKT